METAWAAKGASRNLTIHPPVYPLEQKRHKEHIKFSVSTVDFAGIKLNANEKAFLRMIIDQGGTFQQVAQITGCNASTVRRKFRRMLKKLAETRTLNQIRRHRRLHPGDIGVAREFFVCGTAQQDIAAKYNISRYRVRKIISRIRRLTYQAVLKSARQQGVASCMN